MRFCLLTLAFIFGSFVAQHAEAAPIIFTDRDDFYAVVQPNAIATFDEFVPGLFAAPVGVWCATPYGDPFCGGVADDFLRLAAYDAIPSNPFNGNLQLVVPGYSGTFFNLVDGSPFLGFGFDVSASPIQSVNVGWYGPTPENSGFLTFFSPTFVGLYFPFAPPTTMLVDAFVGPPFPSSNVLSPRVVVDNIAVRTVPEPSSALLVLAGASPLLLARRRRAGHSKDAPFRPIGPLAGFSETYSS
jgi:hypothetical protein